MEIRSKTDTHVTIRYSLHELDVITDIITSGREAYLSDYGQGKYQDRSKGYKTTANKIGAGWSIVPKL